MAGAEPSTAQRTCGIAAILVFLMALVSGTGATLASKVLFDMDVENSEGETVKFTKPLMATFIMFVAMGLALPLHVVMHVCTHGFKPLPPVTPRVLFILAAPAVTDLLGTTCAMIGLVYVKVSVYQLVRASVIVFVAAYRVAFKMPPPFRAHNWIGVAMNVLAIVAIGSSAFFDPTAGSNVALGILVLLLGCSIMAAQLVLEEKVMAGGDQTPPLVVVGMEGVWGTLIMLLVMFPIAKRAPGNDLGGCYEDLDDTLAMFARASNESLRGVAFGYMLCITGYNVAAIFITFLLEAVWRSILENFRPVAVWGTDLALFYVFTAGGFGEAWTVWSWLELAGMIVLLLGTAVYNGSVQVPGLEYFPELQRQYSISDSVLGSPLIAGALSPTGTAVAPEKRAAERQRLIQAGEPTYNTAKHAVQESPL